MKDNANPIIHSVLPDTSHTENSRIHQVATSYLDPFLSQQDNNVKSIQFYSPQLLSSYHAAICDVMGIDKQDKSASRDACNILKTFGNAVGTQNAQDKPFSSFVWQPKITFGTSNIFTQNSSVSSKYQRNRNVHSHETNRKSITNERDSITPMEIFNIIRNIQDPEHPLTLEQLNVVNIHSVSFTSCENKDGDNDKNTQEQSTVPTIYIQFTPTIPHCSMATLIGLCIKVKLMRSVNNWNIDVRIKKGTHVSETAINRQLNDKERVKASLENEHLLNVVNKCVRGVVTMR
jgi:metal-sulfur cluster biosynthetic enzyme